jgi:cell division protein FtsA
MRNKISVGIDIGTNMTKVIVLGEDKDNQELTVLGTGSSPTDGVRLGFITNINQVAESLSKAVKQAESMSGVKIRDAYISCGGINLSAIISSGSIIISRSDQEITNLDINKVLETCEDNLELVNKKIVHIIPLSYKLDGKEIFERPEGMHGIKLEAKTLFVVCSKQNIEDLIAVMGLVNIDVIDVVASSVALGNVLLGTKQKTAGSAILDIGTDTVSIAVYENNLLISLQVFQIGGMDITKDIALGLRISLDEAESIKHGSVIGINYPKKKIDEIIEARLSDIFELVEGHLKKIRRNQLLPAGIIITGGGSAINQIDEIARTQLKIPARIGPIDNSLDNRFKIRDGTWYTALGLALLANTNSKNNNENKFMGENISQVKNILKSFFKQLMP